MQSFLRPSSLSFPTSGCIASLFPTPITAPCSPWEYVLCLSGKVGRGRGHPGENIGPNVGLYRVEGGAWEGTCKERYFPVFQKPQKQTCDHRVPCFHLQEPSLKKNKKKIIRNAGKDICQRRLSALPVIVKNRKQPIYVQQLGMG